ARRRRRPHLGGSSARLRNPGGPVRGAGIPEPHPPRARAGVGALPRGRARVHGGGGFSGRRGPAFGALSPREREVLSLVAEGLGNAEIAERLSLSEKTVRNHVSNLFDKLGVWTRAQAMVFAHDHGFRGT